KKPATGGSQQTGSSKNDAMELSSDDDAPVLPLLASNSSPPAPAASIASASAPAASADSIQLVLEENSKWSLLVDTLEEIEADVCSRADKFQAAANEAELGGIMRGHTVKREDGTAAPTAPPRLPPSFGRTLLIVRDDRT